MFVFLLGNILVISSTFSFSGCILDVVAIYILVHFDYLMPLYVSLNEGFRTVESIFIPHFVRQKVLRCCVTDLKKSWTDHYGF